MMDVEYVVKQITKKIRDYVKSASVSGIVIGLSGGIDSAVVHRLCVEALEPDYKVYSVYISDKHSEPDNYDLVKKLAYTSSDVDFTYMSQERAVGMMRTIWSPSKPPKDITEANLRSRLRMCILYMLANEKDCLVAGTTNKTEAYVGYYTKYGDGGVDIEPIGELYKGEVYQIANHFKLPTEVLIKAPSAGLWSGQTDEEELGYTYVQLDKIVALLTNDCGDRDDAIAELTRIGITPKDVKHIKEMADKNWHKKKMPTVFNIEKEVEE